MSFKIVKFGLHVRNKILKGIDILTDAVKITLGPMGNNVIIEKDFGGPLVTKDGVTVAKEIDLKDRLENIGCQMLKEVASKTNEDSGDGTTTATVLAQSIIKEGFKYLLLGFSAVEIRRDLNLALNIVLDKLNNQTKLICSDVEISQVGSISANNDSEIGNMITKAMRRVGKDGVISVEEGKSFKDELEIVEGMQFEKGFLSPYFVNDLDKQRVVYENPFILISDSKIDNFRKILPLLEKISKTGSPLLIISDGIDSEILTSLVLNNIRGILKVTVVKAPYFGDRKTAFLEDLSILTGTVLINSSSSNSFEKLKLNQLGSSKRVEIYKDRTVIVKGCGDSILISQRICRLKEDLKDLSEYDSEKMKERIAKMAGGVALIKVGASTDIEMKERRFRIEDALNATKAAVDEGVLPGGGIALLRLSMWIKKKYKNYRSNVGLSILIKAMMAPFCQIIRNAGMEPAIVLEKIKCEHFNYGYDLVNNLYCDLIKNGVVDPTKVVKNAIKNALSISILILTTSCSIFSGGSKKINMKDSSPILPD